MREQSASGLLADPNELPLAAAPHRPRSRASLDTAIRDAGCLLAREPDSPGAENTFADRRAKPSVRSFERHHEGAECLHPAPRRSRGSWFNDWTLLGTSSDVEPRCRARRAAFFSDDHEHPKET